MQVNKILKTAGICTLLSTAMFVFGYAMVPLYYKFCEAFGIEVASPEVVKNIQSTSILPRELRVEFDTNSHNDIVAMHPEIRTIQLNTGTAYKITYTITNLTDHNVIGRAVPAYLPARSAKWFNKLHCFCFDELHLSPNEVRIDPVVFILQKDLPDDIEVVSLAYTFFVDEQKISPHSNHNS